MPEQEVCCKFHNVPRKKVTVDQFFEKLPEQIPVKTDVYLVGGMERNGYSYHDVDLITTVSMSTEEYSALDRIFWDIAMELGTYSSLISKRPTKWFLRELERAGRKIYENGKLVPNLRKS